MKLITEQREAARLNLSQACEMEIKQLVESNRGQIQRLAEDVDEHRRRLRFEVEAKERMYVENIVALDAKQREKLESLRRAMESSVEEWEILEEKRQNDELEKYHLELEEKLNSQIEEIAMKLVQENEREVAKRHQELNLALESMRKSSSELQSQIANSLQTQIKPPPKPAVSPIAPLTTADFSGQTVTYLPDYSDVKRKIESFDKPHSEECAQIENEVMRLITATNAEEIEIEARTMRMERWKKELERMAEELQEEGGEKT